MVIVKEKHNQETERDGDEDPFYLESLEVDQPISRLRWIESTTDGESTDICSL